MWFPGSQEKKGIQGRESGHYVKHCREFKEEEDGERPWDFVTCRGGQQ